MDVLFKDNRLDGEATKYFENGDVQTFNYKMGLMNGESVLTKADGKVIQMQFVNGRLTKRE